jgi:glutaredoxin
MKELLDRADLQYTEVLVSSLPAEEKKELKEKYSDMISYPYAVIDNELIGGLVPVAKLLLQKGLVSSGKNERT